MADQVEVTLPKTVYNEGTQFTATARFRTRATAVADTPTTVHYKIYNLTREEIVKDWTSVAAAGEVSITVTASLNDLEDNSYGSVAERFELLVASNRGLSTQVIGRAPYKVRNIRGYG